MKLASQTPQRITAAAITCTAILVPAAAPAPAARAAAAKDPAAAAARPARPGHRLRHLRRVHGGPVQYRD